ncbi:MAG: hypothetical protein K0R54_19 [Clostridiaceae bacterium]|jgi:tRNA (cmo5U34)-methyltransferase|nr:hypothetical protein [Clostridiaceae bacterium]
MQKYSSWEFDAEISNIFDEHVRQSVPGYDQIQNLIYHLSDFYIQDSGIIFDIGCSTGETINTINRRHVTKNTKYIGIDNSASMIKKAIQKNKHNHNAHFINIPIENYEFKEKSNFIMSILTMQFIPLEQRKNVVKNIYNALFEDGAFVFVEKTYAKTSKTQEIFTQLYHDFKEEHHLSTEAIREKDKSLRGIMTPLTVEENINMLTSCGFKVDIFYKNLNFIGFLAIK